MPCISITSQEPAARWKTVHILGQHGHPTVQGFQAGDRIMSGIGMRVATTRLDLRQETPGDVGPALEHGAGKSLLDRQADVGVGILVEAADAAVGRQARIGRQAGASDDEDALCGGNQATRGLDLGGVVG